MHEKIRLIVSQIEKIENDSVNVCLKHGVYKSSEHAEAVRENIAKWILACFVSNETLHDDICALVDYIHNKFHRREAK